MIIEYLSAMPGAGKTTWILKHMYENFKKKRCIIVYAAPTKLLLTQVQADLFSRYNIHGEIILKERGDSTIIEEKIDDFLYEAKKGDILLISHEALLRSKKRWHNSDIIELIVDEQMTLIREIPQFQPQIKISTWDSLFEPIVLNTFSEIKIRKGKIKEAKELRKKLCSDAETHDSLSIKFLDWIMDSTFEVFAQCKKNKDFMKVSSVSIVSTSVFNNVNRAILVGAFLDSTEMFHVLKRDGHELVEMKENVFLRDMEHRFSKLKIYPLFARKRIISKSSRSLLVCPTEFKQEIEQKYYKKGKFQKQNFFRDSRIAANSRRDLNSKCKSKGKQLPEKDDRAIYFEDNSRLTVIDYFLKVWKTHPLFGLKEESPTLLAANRDILTEQITSLPARYLDKLLSPKSHGLNSYTRYNRIAYFATMLPNPNRGKFYKDVLKGYSSKEWTINALAQSVTRTAVRNPDSNETVNVLVPDFECAMELKKKFYDLPKILKLDIFNEYSILENHLYKDYTGLTHDEKKRRRSSDYYQENQEEIKKRRAERYQENKEAKADYYQKNKEAIKKRRAERYQENKEEIKKRSAERYQENKEDIRQKRNERYQENKDTVRKHGKRRDS